MNHCWCRSGKTKAFISTSPTSTYSPIVVAANVWNVRRGVQRYKCTDLNPLWWRKMYKPKRTLHQKLTAIIIHPNKFASQQAPIFQIDHWEISAGNHRWCIFLNRHSHDSVDFMIYTFDWNTFKSIQSIRWVNYFLAKSKVKIFLGETIVEILNASGGEIWLKISILEVSSWTRDI